MINWINETSNSEEEYKIKKNIDYLKSKRRDLASIKDFCGRINESALFNCKLCVANQLPAFFFL